MEQALNLLPDRYRDPAGVADIVKDGEVSGLTLGCWLARNIDYRRVPGSGDDLLI